MKKFAVTVGVPHDERKKPVVIAGPEVPVQQQIGDFKALKAERLNKEYSQVVLLRSAGSRKARFISPAEAKAREKILAAEAAAQEELAQAPDGESETKPPAPKEPDGETQD